MKKIVILIITVIFPLKLAAQESYALPFVRIDRNPVTSAMGGTQVTSPVYNPAVIPFAENQYSVSFQSWAPGTISSKNINLLGAQKIGNKMGISLISSYQIGKQYSIFDNGGNSIGYFKPSDYLIGLGLGYSITDYLSAGINVKFAGSSIAEDVSYNAFLGDLFILYIKGKIKASAGIASIGTPVKSGNTTYSLPTSFKAGAAYTFIIGTDSIINTVADFDLYFKGGITASIGAEYSWKNKLSGRAGFHLGTGIAPLPTYLSFGLGYKIFGGSIDISYITASKAIGNTINIGLSYFIH